MTRHASVNAQLKKFSAYLSDRFPQLRIETLYDNQNTQAQYDARDKEAFRRGGVYLGYSETDELLYIGKADVFLKRFFVCANRQGVRYIDVVPFDREHAPFHLALEAFLIGALNPPLNKLGRSNGT